MATVKIMQGDEYDIYINFKQDNVTLKPALVEDIEICVGTGILKTYKDGSVLFDNRELKWYFRLTQQETLAMEEGQHQNIARIKYTGASQSDVVGIRLDSFVVTATTSTEVL